VNVPLFTRLEGCIECTQRDGHPVFIAFLPEKLRSTLAAEGASSCWRGPVFPKQVCAGEQPQVTLRDTAVCCKSCSMCLAAHGAVAVCGGSQFRAQLIPNASAEATPSMWRFGHLPLPPLMLIEPHRTTARVALDRTIHVSTPLEVSGCSDDKADQFLAATKRPVVDASNVKTCQRHSCQVMFGNLVRRFTYCERCAYGHIVGNDKRIVAGRNNKHLVGPETIDVERDRRATLITPWLGGSGIARRINDYRRRLRTPRWIGFS
jgi:hypothetical protein